LRDKGVFTPIEFDELSQSYYLLMGMRLRKQAGRILRDHVRPDNFVELTGLTRIEQKTLREIFRTIAHFQEKIGVAFRNQLFG